MNKMVALFFVVLCSFISGCTTVTSTKAPGVFINEGGIPDPEFAYFVVKTQGKIGLKQTAIILHAIDKKDDVSVEFGRKHEYQLLKVKPTEYNNNFGIYIWDVFYWYCTGNYKVDERLKKTSFTAEKNKVYYLGYFDENLFKIETNYEDEFRQKYPSFSDMQIINPYKE